MVSKKLWTQREIVQQLEQPRLSVWSVMWDNRDKWMNELVSYNSRVSSVWCVIFMKLALARCSSVSSAVCAGLEWWPQWRRLASATRDLIRERAEQVSPGHCSLRVMTQLSNKKIVSSHDNTHNHHHCNNMQENTIIARETAVIYHQRYEKNIVIECKSE